MYLNGNQDIPLTESNKPIRNTLPDVVKDTIQRYGLLQPGNAVLVAVSGGIDSMVLLRVIQLLGYPVEAAHFDHQSRGGASAEDADFVRKTCAEWGIAFHFGTEAVESDARESRLSFENYARGRRYAFLTTTAKQKGIQVIATGHQQDDQAETVLMGMLGLASGIGPGGYAPLLEQEGLRIVRPLVDCGREMLIAWARATGIPWRDDATNEMPICARNRVRLEVLPALIKSVPDTVPRLVRLGETYRSIMGFLDQCAAEFLRESLQPAGEVVSVRILSRERFVEAPEALRRHVIKVLAHRNNIRIPYEHGRRAEAFILGAGPGKYFDFGKGMLLYTARDGIHILPASAMDKHTPRIVVPVAVPGETLFGGYTIRARIIKNQDEALAHALEHSDARRQYFDLEALNGAVEARFRRQGDMLVPFGKTHDKKVKDVMIACGIPEYQRDTLPLLIFNDRIIWAVGCRRSALAPVMNTTRNMLELECLPGGDR